MPIFDLHQGGINNPKFGLHPGGINNRAAANALPTDQQGNPLYVRNASNLIFRAQGDCFTRPGVSQVMTAFNARDGWSCPAGMFYRDGSTVFAFDGQTATPICYEVTGLRIAWTHDPGTGMVYFSDGLKNMEWDGSSCQKLGIDPPATAPGLNGANVLGNGSVTACYTYLTADGRESGPSRAVTADNGRVVTDIRPSQDGRVTQVAVYMSLPNAGADEDNSGILHLAGIVPNGTSLLDVSSAEYQHGLPLRTTGCRQLPAASHLCVHGTRLLAAQGSSLLWSNETDPWLWTATRLENGVWNSDTIPFTEDINLLAAVPGGGIYVCTDTGIYYGEGWHPDDVVWRKVSGELVEYGSLCYRVSNGNPIFYGEHGFTEAKLGGELVPLTDRAAVSMDTSGAGGAALTLLHVDGTEIAVSVPQQPVRGKRQARDWGQTINRATSII
jgi:hypothetical protein